MIEGFFKKVHNSFKRNNKGFFVYFNEFSFSENGAVYISVACKYPS